MTTPIDSESVLSGVENLAALCISLGLLLGLLRKLSFPLPSRLGMWMMVLGGFLLVLVVTVDRLL